MNRSLVTRHSALVTAPAICNSLLRAETRTFVKSFGDNPGAEIQEFFVELCCVIMEQPDPLSMNFLGRRSE